MAKQKIKVSVIMPVYNSAQFLPECLNCVINQTLRDIEIICIDDGSTDGSLQILEEYAQKDSRITVLKQKHQYAGVARNKGMEHAKGEYLSFLDSDDMFEPVMLEEMYNAAVQNDTDITVCNAKIYDNGTLLEDKILAEDSIPNGVFSCADPKFASFVFQIFIGMPWNKLFKRSFVQKQNIFFSSTLHHNDTAFVMGSFAAAQRIIYLPKYFIYWRWRRDSISHLPTISDSIYRSIHDLYNNISGLKNYPLIERSFINFIIDYTYRFYTYSTSEEHKILAVACIKAFYREFNIGKYPQNYFYQPQNYRLINKLAQWNLLPATV